MLAGKTPSGASATVLLALVLLVACSATQSAHGRDFRTGRAAAVATLLRGGAGQHNAPVTNDPSASTYTKTEKGPWWTEQKGGRTSLHKASNSNNSNTGTKRPAEDQSKPWWPEGDSRRGSSRSSVLSSYSHRESEGSISPAQVAIAAPILLLVGRTAAQIVAASASNPTKKLQAKSSPKANQVAAKKVASVKQTQTAHKVVPVAPKPAAPPAKKAAPVKAKPVKPAAPPRPVPKQQQQQQAKLAPYQHKPTATTAVTPANRMSSKSPHAMARQPVSRRLAPRVQAALMLTAVAGIIFGLRELKVIQTYTLMLHIVCIYDV
jgi:hypothetical protein